MKAARQFSKALSKRDSQKSAATRWILKLNPKGQATVPMEVRRMLGVNDTCRELELVLEKDGFHLRPSKPPLSVDDYIGYCAEELREITDAPAFIRELRGRNSRSSGA